MRDGWNIFWTSLGVGLLVVVFAALVHAQSVSPYNAPAPGLFSDQMNQMQTLSNSTDLYLQQQQRYWHPKPLYLPPVTPAPYNDGTADAAEFRSRQKRIMQAYTDLDNARLERALAEVRHLELLNAIEGRR